MPRYQIYVKVWDEYVVGVKASTLKEAEDIAIECCELRGDNLNGGRDMMFYYEMEEEEEEEE